MCPCVSTVAQQCPGPHLNKLNLFIVGGISRQCAHTCTMVGKVLVTDAQVTQFQVTLIVIF